jgi:hypothetical protein
MCEEFLILEEGSLDGTMFQPHGETHHFQKEVMDSLNYKLPEKWTGKGGQLRGHLVHLTVLP